MRELLGGKTAVVTGGSSGIGRQISLTFARHGADIVIADVRADPREDGRPTHERIDAELDANAEYVECDVTSRDDLRNAISTAETFGGIDVMVNNAGIYRKQPFLEVTAEDYDLMMDIHVRGTFFGSQAAAEAMVNNDGGAIVNLSSMAGTLGGSHVTTYCAAKGAIRLLTYSMAAELGPEGIRVNALHPGFIETTMTTEDVKEISEERDEPYIQNIPLQRVGMPEDVANVALFLASDLAEYVTAESVAIDGGVANTGND
jgi:NAD(P)-dependent dehydrogenase (short-subunit alcohol dehydrogenase family)